MGVLTNDVRRFWWAVLAIALLTIVTRLQSLLHPQAIGGTALEEDFAKDPPTYVVDVQFPAKNAHYPVRDFPILAGLLAERYRPVAWTSEGVIYQMNSSRGASEKSAGAENNRSD